MFEPQVDTVRFSWEITHEAAMKIVEEAAQTRGKELTGAELTLRMVGDYKHIHYYSRVSPVHYKVVVHRGQQTSVFLFRLVPKG